MPFCALPRGVLKVAEEVRKIQTQLKSGANVVGNKLNRLDNQMLLLNQESQKVQETLASHVAKRLEETDIRPARHEAASAKIILCVLSVPCIRRSGRSER